jgi:hypothetical protein
LYAIDPVRGIQDTPYALDIKDLNRSLDFKSRLSPGKGAKATLSLTSGFVVDSYFNAWSFHGLG